MSPFLNADHSNEHGFRTAREFESQQATQLSTSLRRVFRELRQFRVHVIPRLRVRREDFELRVVQTRIVQSRSSDALSDVAQAAEESRTALRAKTAHVIACHLAGCFVILRRSFRNLESAGRDVHDRCERAAGRFLAVATMTVEHHDRLGANFVTNCAAGATTGKVRGHN